MNSPILDLDNCRPTVRIYCRSDFSSQLGIDPKKYATLMLAVQRNKENFDCRNDVWFVLAADHRSWKMLVFSNAFGCDREISVDEAGEDCIPADRDRLREYLCGLFPTPYLVGFFAMVASFSRQLMLSREMASAASRAFGCSRARWLQKIENAVLAIALAAQRHFVKMAERGGPISGMARYASKDDPRWHEAVADGTVEYDDAVTRRHVFSQPGTHGSLVEWDVMWVPGNSVFIAHFDPFDHGRCDYAYDLSFETKIGGAELEHIPNVVAIAIGDACAPRIRATAMDIYAVRKTASYGGRKYYVVVNDDGEEISVPEEQASVVATE